MHIQHAIIKVLTQLGDAMRQLTPQQYEQRCQHLFNASIGQHVRHTIELFIELDKGYATGAVNYDRRKRDLQLETDLSFALAALEEIFTLVDKPDKELLLHFDDGGSAEIEMCLATNYQRELLYNLEHTVHHMALIRVGINEVAGTRLPDDFGIGLATSKYRKACVQ